MAENVFERSAVEGRRDILEAALNRAMGQTTIAQVRQEFERRVQTGEFIAVEHAGAGQQYTTSTMLRWNARSSATCRKATGGVTPIQRWFLHTFASQRKSGTEN